MCSCPTFASRLLPSSTSKKAKKCKHASFSKHVSCRADIKHSRGGKKMRCDSVLHACVCARVFLWLVCVVSTVTRGLPLLLSEFCVCAHVSACTHLSLQHMIWKSLLLHKPPHPPTHTPHWSGMQRPLWHSMVRQCQPIVCVCVCVTEEGDLCVSGTSYRNCSELSQINSANTVTLMEGLKSCDQTRF